MRRMVLVHATVALMTMSGSSALAKDNAAIYDSLKIAPNVPSEGPEAYAFKEFGDEVTFAGSARSLERVTVTLSSWGCQTGHWYGGNCNSAAGATFQQAITLNVYQAGVNNTAGALIATQTRTFRVPYRPSASTRCTGGEWYAGSLGCFNGLERLVGFDFRSQNITLPNTVVYGISYNSTHYGPAPIGEGAACFTSSGGCPYDSLNIGLGPKVNVGSKPLPDTIFQNASVGSQYCDNGAAGVATFRLDSPSNACWAGFVPAVRFTARRVDARDGDNTDSTGDDQSSGGDGNGDNGD